MSFQLELHDHCIFASRARRIVVAAQPDLRKAVRSIKRARGRVRRPHLEVDPLGGVIAGKLYKKTRELRADAAALAFPRDALVQQVGFSGADEQDTITHER